MIENMTREQRTLVNMTKASSAGTQSRSLEHFFDDLDANGWLVELARVHVRICSGVVLRHYDFGIALQLRDGRGYRLALIREDEVRCALVELARAMLKIDDVLLIQRAQRSAEYQRLQLAKSIALHTGANRLGRKLDESIYAISNDGLTLESLRLQSGLTLKNWAARIGTSENTYRRRLSEAEIPSDWLLNARDALDRRQSLAIKQRPFVSVSDEELTAAFAAVWITYLKYADSLRSGGIAPKPVKVPLTPEEQAAADKELFKYVPSPEMDLETGEISMPEPGQYDEPISPIDEDRDELAP